MDRRLIVLVGLAVAVVGYGVRLAMAQSPAASAPAAAPLSAGEADLPLPAGPPAGSPTTGPATETTTSPATPVPSPTPVDPLPPAEVPSLPGDAMPSRPAPFRAQAPAPAPRAAGQGMPESAPAPAPADPPAQAPPGALPPVPALPPPGEAPAPAVGASEANASANAEAPRDPQVEKVQIPIPGARATARATAPDHGPLPPAAGPSDKSPSGSGTASPPDSADREPKSFVLPADKLPLGRQAVGLTVEVVGPPVVNLNHPLTLKVVVRNTGTADAMHVVVRDELPEGLTFLSSQPEAQRSEPFLFWELGTVATGSERVISLKVKPVKVGPFEHAATVTMLAGSKSRTIVREPRLKVELIATPIKVLKGQQVQFRIAVSNPGTGPARNVVIRARLTPGLRHESGEPNDQNLFEQTIDQIESGQRVMLESLVADAVAAGEQSCEVVAQSADVSTGLEEARSQSGITVVEPKLRVAVTGDERRFTDTIASYTITVENPGTSTANNVRVLATLPVSGRLAGPPPSGARWDPSSGKLLWTIPQVEPGEKGKEKVTLPFQVRMGSLGFYQVTVDARGDGLPTEHASFKTEVQGLVDFQFEIVERRRVVDVGDTTAFQIRIKNVGTKAATNLLVKAMPSKNIDPLETNNSYGDSTEAQFNPTYQPDPKAPAYPLLVFPKIDHLDPGKEVILGIKVKAVEKGLGTCRVLLTHDDLDEKEASLEDMANFRITAPRAQR